MSTQQTESIQNNSLSIHRFSIDDYHNLGEVGILKEDDRVELIEGRITDMTPIGSKHAACVDRLTNLLVKKLGDNAIVRVQNPIDLTDNDSEPEPDIAILKRQSDFYAEHHPTASDVLLIIEVADSSMDYDRFIKIPLYAKAGIHEVWLVNLLDNTIETYRSPSSEGYGIMTRLLPAEALSPVLFPDINIKVAEILG